jgi:hypothetical protein
MINVVLKPKKEIQVSLKPEQGIQIEATKKYLFDPAIVQEYVDASAENAELSQQIYDQFVAESDEFKEEVKVISRETAKDEVSGVVAEVEANVEIAKEASQSAAESAEKAEQNAAKVPDPYEENTALIYKDGVVQWGKAAAENDGVSITENAKGQIQTIGVIDNTGVATKVWNGTRVEYEAIEVKDPDTLYNVSDDEVDHNTSIGLDIGDIGFAPLGIDETQNKRRYLNGQVISQSQFVSFTAKVKNAILLYPSLSATEENWQAEVTNSVLGQCGKFVIDDALGTIRLPKVVNVQGLQDLALMGSIKAESLPNITGKITQKSSNVSTDQFLTDSTSSGITQEGALYIDSWSSKKSIGNGSESYTIPNGFGFNASASSSTYQDNAPVQQEAILYPYFIQVATGVEESVDVTREIELNNPFSLLDYKWSEYELNNASWLLSNGAFHSGTVYKSVYELLLKIHSGTEIKDGVSVKLSTEAYTDTDFVINTVDTTFRLPIKVKLASGKAVVGNGMALGITNGTTNTSLQAGSSGIMYNDVQGYGKNIGVDLTGGTAITNDTSIGVTTDATKSGIETSSDGLKLYFYVGETIQDANVINASGVLTRVAELSDGYISGLGMPSDRYIDLTLGATDSTYTAPANGYFVCSLKSTASNQLLDMYTTEGYQTIVYSSATNQYITLAVPIRVGSSVKIKYTLSTTGAILKFIYAQGEV